MADVSGMTDAAWTHHPGPKLTSSGMASSAYSGMRVTHMVGYNLSGSKADKVLKVWSPELCRSAA